LYRDNAQVSILHLGKWWQERFERRTKFRREYAALLRFFHDHGKPKDVHAKDLSDAEWLRIAELIEEKYLLGEVKPPVSGSLQGAIVGIAMTVKGKAFQDQLEREIEKETLLGKIKTHGAIVISIAALGLSLFRECRPHSPHAPVGPSTPPTSVSNPPHVAIAPPTQPQQSPTQYSRADSSSPKSNTTETATHPNNEAAK
jgi:hypothetical protein